MKRILIFITILAITTGYYGCEKYELGTPDASTIADFSYTISNSGNAPCQVTFTNKSLNAKGYSWDFGNGKTSTEENPVVTFDNPGLFTIKLTCTPENDVHYNQLVKTEAVNIKDPNAGFTQVLYYTSRSSAGGGVHMVIMNDGAPLVQNFETVTLSRPYGIAVDTINRKVYVSDYSLGVIYRFDADGKNPLKILDASVAGQELVGSPEAMMIVGNKLYWGSPGGIFRSDLDGKNPEHYINTGSAGPEYPLDMQYDPVKNKIYLVNDKVDYPGGYFSMNFDGSSILEHLNDIDGTAIELIPSENKVYITAYGVADTPITENGLYLCKTDGTALSKIGDFGSKATWGITIDHKRKKLFWGYKISNSGQDGKIIRSNLDGSGQEDWLTGISPHAMQVAWIKL